MDFGFEEREREREREKENGEMRKKWNCYQKNRLT